MLKWRIAMAAVVAVAVAAAGCSGDTESTTTEAPSSDGEVVFGQGVMPDSIPDDFPVPAGSSIGSTMVIQDGLTEVVMRIGAPAAVTTEFYDIELRNAGYSVDAVDEGELGWMIEFSRDGTKGTLDITEPLEGVSQAVLRYNVP